MYKLYKRLPHPRLYGYISEVLKLSTIYFIFGGVTLARVRLMSINIQWFNPILGLYLMAFLDEQSTIQTKTKLIHKHLH